MSGTQDAPYNPLMDPSLPDMMRLLIVAYVGDDAKRQMALLASIYVDGTDGQMTYREIARQTGINVMTVTRDRREFVRRMALGEKLVPRERWKGLMMVE